MLKSPERRGAVIFTSLFLLFAFSTCGWMRLNRAAPNWDDAWYLSNSLTLYDAWTAGGLLGLARQFLSSLGFKAPLITALPLPFYWIFGRRWHAAYLVNPAAMLVLFVAVWQIGKRLRNERSGLLAVWITGTLPLLYGLSRWYLVEYSMTAVVAMAFWLVLIAAAKPGVMPATALGFVCALGLLLKADFPLFVFPALAYLFSQRRDRLRLLIAILLPCVFIAAPWYFYHWRATLDNAISAGFGTSALVQGTGAVFSAAAIRAYLVLVIERGISLWYLVLMAAAMIATILRRRHGIFRQIAPLALWLLPFVVFLFGGNKDVRYIAPILPAFALALACLLNAATEPWPSIAKAAVIFPLVSLVAISFGWPYSAPDAGYASRYDSTLWGQDEILTAITADRLYHHGEQPGILLGTDRGHFNADNFQLTITQRRLPFRVDTTAYTTSLQDALQQANRAAYVVYKEGGEAESAFFNRHFSELLGRLKESAEWQELPFTQKIPDGGIAHVLRHR